MENENNFENDNSLNVETENETLETETQTEELTAEEIKTLREKAKLADELEEKNKKLYARLKKGETKPKEEEVNSSITAKDVLILSGAGYTHEQDIEFIEKWAKFNGVSIRDAINDKQLKVVLANQQEERKSQELAQTSSKRGMTTPSVDTLISQAQSGKISENDVDKLAEARMLRRKEQLGK